MLAPTVTLAQALRLRSLTPERERAVLEGLAAPGQDEREDSPCR